MKYDPPVLVYRVSTLCLTSIVLDHEDLSLDMFSTSRSFLFVSLSTFHLMFIRNFFNGFFSLLYGFCSYYSVPFLTLLWFFRISTGKSETKSSKTSHTDVPVSSPLVESWRVDGSGVWRYGYLFDVGLTVLKPITKSSRKNLPRGTSTVPLDLHTHTDQVQNLVRREGKGTQDDRETKT